MHPLTNTTTTCLAFALLAWTSQGATGQSAITATAWMFPGQTGDWHHGQLDQPRLGQEDRLCEQETFVAIPMESFTPSPTGRELRLHADPHRLQRAQTFTYGEWPPLDQPAWGAEWEQEVDEEARQRLNPGRRFELRPNRPGQPGAPPFQPQRERPFFPQQPPGQVYP
jgi:hypothetical protein